MVTPRFVAEPIASRIGAATASESAKSYSAMSSERVAFDRNSATRPATSSAFCPPSESAVTSITRGSLGVLLARVDLRLGLTAGPPGQHVADVGHRLVRIVAELEQCEVVRRDL